MAAISVFSRPGSPVILPTPAYMPFVALPGQLGREAIQVPMVPGPDGRLALDPGGIDAAFRAGGHLLVLINPSNPVGRVYSPPELAAVAEVVERHGGRVFADEIHAPLVYPGLGGYGPSSPGGSSTSLRVHLAPAAGHAITAVSASKAWNLPGLKCAQLILTNDADAATWAGHWPLYEHGASTPGVRASIAAYRDGEGLAVRRGQLPGRQPPACWLTCSPSTCPASATPRPRAPTWPGSTAGPGRPPAPPRGCTQPHRTWPSSSCPGRGCWPPTGRCAVRLAAVSCGSTSRRPAPS